MPSTTERGFSLRHYLHVARRRLAVILLLTAVIATLSLAISLVRKPTYAASSEVLVKRENLAANLTGRQAPYIDAQTAERLIETQVELARVPTLAARVVEATGVPGWSPQDFLRSSSAKAKVKADILILTVETSTKSLARRLARSYGEEFTKYRRELDTAELDAAASSVRQELAALGRDGQRTPLGDELQQKLRQIQTLQTLQTSSAVVVRDAETARRAEPGPLVMGAGGVFLGVLLGVGLAMLLESLDTRVRDSGEVAERLGLPLLGRLPEPAPDLQRERKLVLLERPDTDEGEPYSFLRASLDFVVEGGQAQLVMVTSSVQQEGKSTTVSNLAVACARAGRRVVLADLDLVRPAIDRFFRLRQPAGISEVALGLRDVDQVLVHVPIPDPAGSEAGEDAHAASASGSLLVLPAGRSRQGIPVEQLAGVLTRLRERADLVLVDAPPMLQVADAVGLGAKVDALIVVTRLNVVRGEMLDELRRILDGAPVPAIGFVVTGAAEEEGYGSYYRAYYRQQGPWEGRVAGGTVAAGTGKVGEARQASSRAPIVEDEPAPAPASSGEASSSARPSGSWTLEELLAAQAGSGPDHGPGGERSGRPSTLDAERLRSNGPQDEVRSTDGPASREVGVDGGSPGPSPDDQL